jgi:hypothetical protein
LSKKECQCPKSNVIASPSLNVRQLKSRVDFVAFAVKFTRLRRAGHQFLGLCPFHKERHPSFYVQPQKKVFYCFGCGAAGDVFTFVMRAVGCDFYRALQIVADFSDRVALVSGPRSGPRFGVGEGAKPLGPPKAGNSNSQSLEGSRACILAELDATNRRLLAIDATNRAASTALSTPCEPRDGNSAFYLKNQS